MNYVELSDDLKEIADHYESEALGCPAAMKKMYEGNAQMYRLAAQAIGELMDRLVKQACYFEQIEGEE